MIIFIAHWLLAGLGALCDFSYVIFRTAVWYNFHCHLHFTEVKTEAQIKLPKVLCQCSNIQMNHNTESESVGAAIASYLELGNLQKKNIYFCFRDWQPQHQNSRWFNVWLALKISPWSFVFRWTRKKGGKGPGLCCKTLLERH